MYIKKGKEKAETGSRYEKDCLVAGGWLSHFRKRKAEMKTWNSISILFLSPHILPGNYMYFTKTASGPEYSSGAVLGLKCSKWISNFPNIWNIIENIPLHESIQNWSFRYPPRDGICIFISLSPPLLAVGKAEFTAYAAEIMLNLFKLHVYNKENNNCL